MCQECQDKNVDYSEFGTLAERVNRGIEWLDQNAPADWRDRVNLFELRMENAQDCILGQVFGDFWDASKNYGLWVPQPDSLSYYAGKSFEDMVVATAKLGFNCFEYEGLYAELDLVWQEALES